MVREITVPDDTDDDEIYYEDTDAVTDHLPSTINSRREVKAISLRELDLQIYRVEIDLNPPYQRGNRLDIHEAR